MLKISENPPQRWPECRALEDDVGKWWVVRVKPRNEKALAWELQRMGVSYYLPLMTKRTIRRDNGKPRKSIICLFPGYISIADYQERRAEIMRSGRVLRPIEVLDQERFVQELKSVRKALESALELELHPCLAAGHEVIITSGPMQGVQGAVAEFNQRRVYLNVHMFNQAVTVAVDPEQLAQVGNSFDIKSA